MTNRRGSMFLEVIVAIALLSLVVVAIAQLMALVVVQQRAADHRALATREASNAMELIATTPFESLTNEGLAEIEPSPEARRHLTDPRLVVQVTDDEDGAKQIQIEVSWLNRAGLFGEPVRLVAWRHP